MEPGEILEQLKDDETQIREAMAEWMKTFRRAGDFWKSWRAGWKAGLDRALVLLEREDVLEDDE